MLMDRIIGIFKLDVATFEEIEADQNATSQAALVVLTIAIISGLGSGLGASFMDTNFLGSFISSFIAVFVGWLIWSALTYFIGTSFFGGQADMGEMMRVLGFAYAPQVLSIIPCIGWLVGTIWSLIAAFIAVRQGLDLDNTKAFLTIIVGFVVIVLISAVLGFLFGGLAALANAF
ncbi:MAG: YIP1 family protein [Candidatus Promineifilaceae bacterium]|jgi:hypothetical protein